MVGAAVSGEISDPVASKVVTACRGRPAAMSTLVVSALVDVTELWLRVETVEVKALGARISDDGDAATEVVALAAGVLVGAMDGGGGGAFGSV